MGKVVDGVELLRMIRDGEIKNGTTINLYLDQHQIGEYYLNDKQIINKCEERLIDDEFFIDTFISNSSKFEILSEEDEEIDIDNLTEMNLLSESNIGEKINIITQNINELIKAVKQLNKKLEEK